MIVEIHLVIKCLLNSLSVVDTLKISHKPFGAKVGIVKELIYTINFVTEILSFIILSALVDFNTIILLSFWTE